MQAEGQGRAKYTFNAQSSVELSLRKVDNVESQWSAYPVINCPRHYTMVVAFSWLARILGEWSDIHSPPVPFFFFEVEISSCTLIPVFYARTGPQWLSKLRRLWPNIPWLYNDTAWEDLQSVNVYSQPHPAKAVSLLNTSWGSLYPQHAVKLQAQSALI